jgi:hypothetical protein
MLRVAPYLCAALVCVVQAQGPPPAGGVESEWDLKKLLESLSTGARKLKPIIDQSNPQNWRDPQGGQIYAAQYKSTQNHLQYLIGAADRLTKEPESLSLALEAYFRVEDLHRSAESLIEGIRKYQSPVFADQAQKALFENLKTRDRLKGYLLELAQTKEQELRIMDKEAQRCRSVLTRQPPGPASLPKPRSSNQ